MSFNEPSSIGWNVDEDGKVFCEFPSAFTNADCDGNDFGEFLSAYPKSDDRVGTELSWAGNRVTDVVDPTSKVHCHDSKDPLEDLDRVLELKSKISEVQTKTHLRCKPCSDGRPSCNDSPSGTSSESHLPLCRCGVSRKCGPGNDPEGDVEPRRHSSGTTRVDDHDRLIASFAEELSFSGSTVNGVFEGSCGDQEKSVMRDKVSKLHHAPKSTLVSSPISRVVSARDTQDDRLQAQNISQRKQDDKEMFAEVIDDDPWLGFQDGEKDATSTLAVKKMNCAIIPSSIPAVFAKRSFSCGDSVVEQKDQLSEFFRTAYPGHAKDEKPTEETGEQQPPQVYDNSISPNLLELIGERVDYDPAHVSLAEKSRRSLDSSVSVCRSSAASVWDSLRVIETTAALKFQWNDSRSNKLLLKSVSMDTQTRLGGSRLQKSSEAKPSQDVVADHRRGMSGSKSLSHSSLFKSTKNVKRKT